MIRDYYMQQINALGKMLSVILSQFLSKNEGIDWHNLETKIQENEDLLKLYKETDLDLFEKNIKSFNKKIEITLQLIHFFYTIYKNEPNKVLHGKKCLILFDHLDAITPETMQIFKELKKDTKNL